ncbi:MAG: hypothetical protein ACT4N9_06490 [Paracoccaceae bacterium]
MTLEVYLRSHGPEGADTGALLIALGGELDELGAWQIDLGDGAAAEVSGLGATHAQPQGGRSGQVRLSGLTRRGADVLYAIARNGRFAMIVPDPAAAGGVLVVVPAGLDPALLPAEPPYDQAQVAEGPNALFALLSALRADVLSTKSAPAAASRIAPPGQGWLARLLSRILGR